MFNPNRASFKILSVTTVIVLLLFGCNKRIDNKLSKEYEIQLKEYWKKRNDYRKSNYLKLTGLIKLQDSISLFGLKDSIHPVINQPMKDTIGSFFQTIDSIIFTPNKDNIVKLDDGDVIDNINFDLDENGSSQKLYYNDMYWQIITRSDNRFIRVWNSNHPAPEKFKAYQLYPTNTDFIFNADFKYFENVKFEDVKSQLGIPSNQKFIGSLSFSYNNQEYTLDVGEGGFLMVLDATSGEQTYGGGRYLDLELPDYNDTITLDFNKLYNPPCIFSDFTTCIYPPRQNELPFKIFAGETSKPNE